jgi:hypothetical protein
MSSAPFVTEFQFGPLGLQFTENKVLRMVEVVGATGQAYEQGVEGGDLLYSINNVPISDGEHLRMTTINLGKILRDSPRPLQIHFLRPKRRTSSVFHGTAPQPSAKKVTGAGGDGSGTGSGRFRSVSSSTRGSNDMSEAEEGVTYTKSDVLLASHLM